MDRQLYRELSPLEMEIVAGGITTLDRVDALPGWDNPYDVGNGGWGDDWYDYYDGPYDSGGGGGGDSDTPPCTCTAHNAAEVDAISDAFASKIARDIKAQPDWNQREYVSVIYKATDGHLAVGALQRGEGVYATIDFPALGISASQVVGVVHNHPDSISSDPRGDNINRFPSQPGSGALNGLSDWQAADAIVGAGADASTLSLYILGPDGVLREYDYSDKARWISADKQGRAGGTISSSLQPPACAVHPAP